MTYKLRSVKKNFQKGKVELRLQKRENTGRYFRNFRYI